MDEQNVTEEVIEAAPQGEADKDWKAEYERVKAESRKWEGRAKANIEKANKYDELEKLNSDTKEQLAQANARADEAEKASESAKSALEYSNTVSKVSEATGVPRGLLHGETEDELMESAKAILEFTNSQKPNIPSDQGGAAGAQPISRESILNNKNQLDRVRAIAANRAAFEGE